LSSWAEGEEVRRWKLAFSLGIVAAIVAPLAMGTWKLKPGGWQPLPLADRDRIAVMARDTRDCKQFPPSETELSKHICAVLLSDLRAGGRYESGEKITGRYVQRNLLWAGGGFVLVFVSVMIIPSHAILGLAE
jgi:hypothetical protein